MSPHLFTVLFLIALGSTLLVKTGLMLRQIRHVRAHRNAVPGAFADSIGLEAHQRAADYTAERVRLSLVELAVSAVFVLALTIGSGLQLISTLCAGLFDAGSIAHGVALLAMLGVISWVIDLPFSLYRTFVLEKRYNFNRMTPALFVSDSLKQAALAAVIGLPLLTGVLWLMAAMGAAWWVWVWAVWLGFNLLVLLIWPTFIAPLFNRFSPLADEQLKHRVESLLDRCGFRSKGLFVMDGSRRSAHGNAYFTGFGASKRIVFFDTLLDKLTPQEVEAVLAHELGHFHHKHIVKRLLVLAPASLALFALLGWLLSQPAFFNGLGVTQTGTAAGLALFFLALPWFTFALTPLMSQWSRRHEFEADRYAASHTQANDLVSALVKLYRDNASTLTPDPVYSGFFDSHPPAAVRIARLQG
ncbi:peptidase M48 [Parazoarcus communis]|uniref:Peptidase M48 n=1 Tax=Parazoarcus communis TaxID=41977 RepID=A0A2U8GNQ3_9RHOO|nr:M48 family metallopeptidase [Parazoarcus communis]AWI75154.1 peptidase M48 [Parazoarcus communis]|tara:strand:- start:81383 stop:82627 length:1245 start_codon:yes stop_codon:yes gene_type:complete